MAAATCVSNAQGSLVERRICAVVAHYAFVDAKCTAWCTDVFDSRRVARGVLGNVGAWRCVTAYGTKYRTSVYRHDCGDERRGDRAIFRWYMA